LLARLPGVRVLDRGPEAVRHRHAAVSHPDRRR
jgi:hypothetical protein